MFEQQNGELNVKKTITVIDATFAVAKRKPEKKNCNCDVHLYI